MRGTVTVSAPVTYRRWQAPNFATVDRPATPKQDGMRPLPSVPVAELAPEALDALARAWLHDLYEKANRDVPDLR